MQGLGLWQQQRPCVMLYRGIRVLSSGTLNYTRSHGIYGVLKLRLSE